jgi:hypothetical protein
VFDLVPGRDKRLVLRPGLNIDPQPDPVAAFSSWKQFKLSSQEAHQIYDEVAGAMVHIPELFDAYAVKHADQRHLNMLMPDAFAPRALVVA